MRDYNRHAARREKLRKVRILSAHLWRDPRKPWRDYSRLMMTEPGWWTREFHTQPTRIRTHQLCHLIEMDARDPDGIVWPDSRRPHLYYW